MCLSKILKWNIGFEIIILLLFHFFVITYSYYKSSILNGGFGFRIFTSNNQSALISTPIIVLARIYSVNNSNTDENIIIRGENKLDILQKKKRLDLCL
jgi:hypothetical protein